MRPQEIQPVDVVTHDRRVVEHLCIHGIGAPFDQQGCKRFRMRVREAITLALTDDAGQRGERVVPVIIEPGIRVGAVVEQQPRDVQCVALTAR